MLSKGEAVVYKCRGMYKVKEIGRLDFSFADRKKLYYTLQSVDNEKDRAYVPTDDETSIRKPISRDRVLEIIGRMPDMEVLNVVNEKLREQEYKSCISDYCPENWVKVLKTLYKRTKSRGSMTSMDRKYQMLLEHALYSEFSYVLGIPVSQMAQFIREQTKNEKTEK